MRHPLSAEIPMFAQQRCAEPRTPGGEELIGRQTKSATVLIGRWQIIRRNVVKAAADPLAISLWSVPAADGNPSALIRVVKDNTRWWSWNCLPCLTPTAFPPSLTLH